MPGTSGFPTVTEVAAPEGGNTLWLTASSGLKKWNFGDAALTSVTVTNGACTALKCSDDGSVFVVGMGSNKTYVSTDSGNTWTDKSGTAATGKVPSGAPRIEYAISHSPNASGNYSMYAVRTNSNLLGMYVSHDSGNTWSEFVGSSGSPSNLDIYRNQGTYNTIVSVTPDNPEKILVGGIDIWKWEQTTNNPVSGGFEKLTEWFLNPASPKYAHADNHEMQWDGNKLYIGNDGGVGITYNPEIAWAPSNRGYNVTQFYGIAFDRHGAVMGGTQDNGSLYNDHTLSTFKEFREVSGGDGFQCEISFYNPDVIFSTSQFGSVFRSGDRGANATYFVPDTMSGIDPFGTDGSANHPFHTRIFLAEHYDLNSLDSVTFIPDQDYAAGADVLVPSAATGDSILFNLPYALYFSDTLNFDPGASTTETYVVDTTGQITYLSLYPWVHTGGSSQNDPPIIGDTLVVTLPTGIDTVYVDATGTYTNYVGVHPQAGTYNMGLDSVLYNVAWNTVNVQDPYQSWYLMYVNANGGELWGTRNALRLACPDPMWGVVARGIGGGTWGNIDCEFSADLNNLYITSGGGSVIRVDGLGSLYTSQAGFETDAFYDNTTPPAATTSTSFSIGGGSAEGICVNPADPDDIVVVSGFGSNNVRRSVNATSASPSFTNIAGLPGNPGTYDAIIDRNDPDIIVVGTSHGVFVTENGGTTWTDASAGFCGTPVYEVRQSWRSWDDGNFRPGEIYLGTFGRGIWSSSSYLSTNDGEDGSNGAGIAHKTNLMTYPNPATTNTTVTFDLETGSDVEIEVYSLSGRLVERINSKNLSPGANAVEIDVRKLKSGTYIVRFLAGSTIETTKFVKM